MYVFNFLDFFELFINDLVTSSDVKSFFFIPETILVRENSEIFDILFDNLWHYEKFFICLW